MTAHCAIVGSGHIASDLLLKLRRSQHLDVVAMVGIDPESAGLQRARELGVETSHDGIDWVLRHHGDIELVFEATSAHAHAEHAPLLAECGVQAVDLTPAAVGPGVVPTVNLAAHLDAPNLNMVTCGGQATVPIVAAVTEVSAVPYAEIVSTIASRSAGPGTRENIDEFTRTTARALSGIGGAARAKAIIVLNPAEPPIVMRNTVYCALPADAPRDAVAQSVLAMVARVADYVPGYRLKAEPVFDDGPFDTPGGVAAQRVTVLLEVEGAGDWLPPYAGNMDIMTSAAVRVGEALAHRHDSAVAPV